MIDETSRKLIERAAAHLRSRAPAAAAVAAMPQPAAPAEYVPSAHAESGYQPAAYEAAAPAHPVYPQPTAHAVYQQPAPQPMQPPRAQAAQRPLYPPHPAQAAYEPMPQAAAVNGTQPFAYREPGYQPPYYGGQAESGYGPAASALNGYDRGREGTPMTPQAAPSAFSRQISIDRGALARRGITVPSAQRSRVVEEFRIVKRQIVAKYMDEPDDEAANRNRVIMVTSARPREGKTFTAINLALSIATEQDLKVLLIDLDTKHHAMQEMMGIPASYGLTDLLANPDIDFSEVVLRTNMPNLTVMPAGSPNIRSPELLSSRRTRAIFTEMTRRYSDRFIVFDSPAVLASSDPAILAGLVGQILLVVEADHTQQEELETAIGLLSACPSISLLLNKIRTSAADQFGAYSDY
jgi:exopolysaccharide/PEP-CTERM locus tyrosine autokinase